MNKKGQSITYDETMKWVLLIAFFIILIVGVSIYVLKRLLA